MARSTRGLALSVRWSAFAGCGAGHLANETFSISAAIAGRSATRSEGWGVGDAGTLRHSEGQARSSVPSPWSGTDSALPGPFTASATPASPVGSAILHGGGASSEESARPLAFLASRARGGEAVDLRALGAIADGGP